MTGNSRQSGRTAPYSGPQVNLPRRVNASDVVRGNSPREAAGYFNARSEQTGLSRESIATLGQAGGNTQDLYNTLNYPSTAELNYDAFAWLYTRSQFARTIIEKVAEDTWQDAPEIIDSAATEEEENTAETPFEQGCQKLIDGKPIRRSLSHRWFVADLENRIGEYSTMLFSTADENNQDLSQELADDSFSGSLEERLENLWHIQVYAQHRVEIDELEKHIGAKRYGLPQTYQVTPEEGSEETVHHTRMIHIAEGATTNDLYGESALLPVFNRLEDIERLLGGSAEMFWQGAFPGIIATPPILRDENGREEMLDFEDGSEGLAEEVQQYRNKLERLIATKAEVETLEPNIEDPLDHLKAQIQAVSAGISPTIPQNMLVGNELGERATQEDRHSYHEGIQSRRNNFATPQIVRPTIDLLIRVGVLPEPEGGDYYVEWPGLAEMTELDMAEVYDTRAGAFKDAADAAMVAPKYADQFFEKVGINTDVDDPADGIAGADPADEQAPEQVPEPVAGEGPTATQGGEVGAGVEADADSLPGTQAEAEVANARSRAHARAYQSQSQSQSQSNGAGENGNGSESGRFDHNPADAWQPEDLIPEEALPDRSQSTDENGNGNGNGTGTGTAAAAASNGGVAGDTPYTDPDAQTMPSDAYEARGPEEEIDADAIPSGDLSATDHAEEPGATDGTPEESESESTGDSDSAPDVPGDPGTDSDGA